jgi:hypothetical protein
MRALGIVNSRTDNGNSWRLVSRLPGGAKTGAWKVRNVEGEDCVLKKYDIGCSARELDERARLVRTARAADLATLLFSAHAAGAYEERALQRLVDHALALDGVPVFTVALASALFDWVVYATSRLDAEQVAAFPANADTLFERLR